MRMSVNIGVALALASIGLPIVGAVDEPSQPLDLRVLGQKGDAKNPHPEEMLYRHLLDEAQRLFDARRKTIAAIKTPDEIAPVSGNCASFSSGHSGTCLRKHH